MTTWRQVVLRGALAIVAFDAVASIASRLFHFPYSDAVWGSFLIYLAVGYFAAQATGDVGRAALASGIVGAVESTLGWWLSGVLGAGGPIPDTLKTPLLVVGVLFMVFTVTFTASVCGAIGGWVGRKRYVGASSSGAAR